MEQQLGVQQPLDEASTRWPNWPRRSKTPPMIQKKALAELENSWSSKPGHAEGPGRHCAKDTARAAERTLKEKANQPLCWATWPKKPGTT